MLSYDEPISLSRVRLDATFIPYHTLDPATGSCRRSARRSMDSGKQSSRRGRVVMMEEDTTALAAAGRSEGQEEEEAEAEAVVLSARGRGLARCPRCVLAEVFRGWMGSRAVHTHSPIHIYIFAHTHTPGPGGRELGAVLRVRERPAPQRHMGPAR